MEGIIALLLILFLAPIVLGIWAAWRAQQAHRLIRELRELLATLQMDLRDLKAAEVARRQGARVGVAAAEPTGQAPPPEPQLEEPPAPPHLPPPVPERPISAAPSPEPAATAASRTQIPPPPRPLPSEPPGSIPSAPSRPRPMNLSDISWEQFMGVKLFAWLGGLALFLGVAFFVKYSFEHNLIPPEVRVAIGFLVGVALLVGGVRMAGGPYAVTSETLCGTGIVILYAVTFACRSIYHFEFFGLIPTFLLMALITATAFLLAVRLDALVIAVLGMLGGFLTPILLSTGVDNPAGLFGYIALLDVGLAAVALRRNWRFLVALSAAGTVLMQLGWVATFFVVPKLFTAITVFLGFDALFLLPFLWTVRRAETDTWVSASALLFPFTSMGFAFYLVSFPELAGRPGILFGFVLAADLCLILMVWLRADMAVAHLAAGLTAFALLALWTAQHLTGDLLLWALALYLVFAVCHAVFPVILRAGRPGAMPAGWAHLFPALALLLILGPIQKLETLSLAVWPAVLFLDLLVIGVAVMVGSLLSVVGALALTVLATALWILRVPAQLAFLPQTLVIVGGFAVLFLLGAVLAARWIGGPGRAAPGGQGASPSGGFFTRSGWPVGGELLGQVLVLSAALPFLLLILLVGLPRLPLADPSPVFGLALLLALLLLGMARGLGLDVLAAVAMAGVLLVEHAWHAQHLQAEFALRPVLWYVGFYAVFTVYPFAFAAAFADRMIPWAASALAGPLHFFLVYRLVSAAWPNAYMGLLPAAFAVPAFVGLGALLRILPEARPARTGQLAWFGGAALLFVTLIFPIQFERQWITIGWALEGAALLWLFHRVPHDGLRVTGMGLLGVAFARLALNPAVLSYHPRSATPLLNWYLYAYGVVTACLFAGARLLAPPRDLLFSVKVPPILNGLGTVLAFLLLNIEIADYFSEAGSTLTFEFSGNLARDMTYSIAWAVFALVLLLVGMAQHLRGARYASLGLLGVTLLKLFLHDLAHLGQLYRIGALIGVAAIAILASFLYQRFLAAARLPQ